MAKLTATVKNEKSMQHNKKVYSLNHMHQAPVKDFTKARTAGNSIGPYFWAALVVAFILYMLYGN